MQTFAALRDKLSNRRIRPNGFQEFEAAFTDIDHGHLDALIVHLVGARNFQSEHGFIHFCSVRHGFYGDPEMIYFHEVFSLSNRKLSMICSTTEYGSLRRSAISVTILPSSPFGNTCCTAAVINRSSRSFISR